MLLKSLKKQSKIKGRKRDLILEPNLAWLGSQSRMISMPLRLFSQTVSKHTYSNWKNWPKRCPPAVAAAWSKQTESLNNLSVLQLLFGQTAQPPNKRWIHGWYVAILKKLCHLPSHFFCCCTSFLFFASAWLNPSQPNTCCNTWMPFKVLTS